MRKFLLLALFVVLAYLANMYFSTGKLPFMPERQLTKEEQELRELKEEFLALKKRYFEYDPDDTFTYFEEIPTAEWAQRQTDLIEKKLNRLKPKITSEFAKAEVGWLNMHIRKFRKLLRSDETG